MGIRTLSHEDPDSLQLRVDHIVPSTASGVNDTMNLYCTDIERTQTRIAITELSSGDDSVEHQQGQWYEFDQITRTHGVHTAGTPAFSVKSGDKHCTHIEPPTMNSPSGSMGATASNMAIPKLSEQSDRIGLTVTAIPTTNEESISPGAPDKYEITAVCIDPFDTSTDPPVYHRAAADTHDERVLLEHVVEDLVETDAETVVTWGNNADPIELLASRHRQLNDGNILYRESADIFGGFYYANLSRLGVRHGYDDIIKMAQSLEVDITAKYPRFDTDAIESDPTEWRADWDLTNTPLTDRVDTRLIKRDYRALLESHFAGDSTTPEALAECLQSFVSAKLGPLQAVSAHEVATQLGCPRLTTTA
ncbi:hypothetical protein [Haloquadratum walsbyi]|jgi:hypothetical protein|uniref:Uncharacterized protein n=1 Tax=Haloquadratum walsbyi J07HQW2 TaxID=1238425 RepID=U1MWA9_9EURY|nr:hypothetical protein [Haloquadratum walsbyi]ERG94719.1 MAG: hypothetical protein J07HQW2_01160 [Haloquadratum walsbyi J07HQW2]